MNSPDLMARGFVNYLASQQLADSLAKAKAEMAKQAARRTPRAAPAKAKRSPGS